MTGYLTGFLNALRLAVNAKTSKREAIFKDVVEAKLFSLMAVHTDFLGILRVLENDILAIIRKRSITITDLDVSKLEFTINRVQRALYQDKAARRILYEEARIFAENETGFVSGFIRALDDKEENLVRVFLHEIVMYFEDPLKGEKRYHHKLGNMIETIRGSVGLLERCVTQGGDLLRVDRIIASLRAQRQRVIIERDALVEKWACVARAYSAVRQQLASPTNANISTDFELIFGDQLTNYRLPRGGSCA